MLPLTLLMLAASSGPVKVAIPNFSTINVPAESASFFMDRFANRLRATGLAVTTATEIEAVLGLERQKTLTGCQESSACTAELAAALGVDAILRARLARFGDRYEVTFTLIDARTAGVLGSATDGASSETSLLDALDKNADALARKLLAAKGASPAATLTATGGAGPRPAWVAATPGVLGLGAAVVGGLFVASSFQKVEQIATAADPVGLADSAKGDRFVGLSLVGVGVAAIAASVVLFLGREAGTPQPVAVLSPDGAYLGMTWSLP